MGGGGVRRDWSLSLQHNTKLQSFAWPRLLGSAAFLKDIYAWVHDHPQHRGDMEWDGLDRGGIPGPYDPKYRKFQRWKVLIKELSEGESFPSDSTPGDYIFSHRSLRNCPDKCAIGITLWVPDTASVMADIVPFPIHVGHALCMPAPPSPQIFQAGYAYVRHIVLRPGFNTIAWSAHSSIMYGQGLVRKVEPTLAFPGNKGYSFSTLSLTSKGTYSPSLALAPIPYDVQGGSVPLHISAYVPQGATPPLRFLSALALGTVPPYHDILQEFEIRPDLISHHLHWMYMLRPDSPED